jgi:hypothetical protein
MIVYLYFKDKKNIENCEEQMYCSFYILVYFSLKKKTYEGTYHYLKPHNKNYIETRICIVYKSLIENMPHFLSYSEC